MTTTSHTAPATAAWMSSPSFSLVDIVAQLRYDAVVLDIEHGSFDLADLERLIPYAKKSGLQVLAKVLGPERGPIQQALDFGADAVVIPHIEGVEHARAVSAFAKFAPLGDRSFAGGRVAAYGGIDDAWLEEQNAATRVFPMVEHRDALRDVDAILALPTVDGVFVGPSDLSLTSGRGAYSRGSDDFAALATVAQAAAAANKPWVLPAWAPDEKQFALDHGAAIVVLEAEHGALKRSFAEVRARFTDLIPA